MTTAHLAAIGVLAGLNVLTTLMYGYDKLAARAGRRRVRESTLHILAAAGGTPGAFVGQRLFRHKTRDRAFRRVFGTIVVAQLTLVLAIAYLWRR